MSNMNWTEKLLAGLLKSATENTGNEPSISCFHRAFDELKSYVLRMESERDELKAKLAQFERELPKTPEGFPELDKDHLIKICIHQQSKLAELESQEPVGEIKYYKPEKSAYVQIHWHSAINQGDKLYTQPKLMQGLNVFGWFSDHRGFTKSLEQVERWNDCEWMEVYSVEKPPQPIANNSSPAQRITEQDAREIGRSLFQYAKNDNPWWIDNWIESEAGIALLDKLNEHREPVEPYGWFIDVEYHGFTRTKPTKYLDCAIALYEGHKVTPNKAEVHSGLIPVYQIIQYQQRDWVDTSEECYNKCLGSKDIKTRILYSLAPLKGDDKWAEAD